MSRRSESARITRERVIELTAEGLSDTVIGIRVGKSVGSVRAIKSRLAGKQRLKGEQDNYERTVINK